MTQKFEEKIAGGDAELVASTLASWRARLHTGLAKNSTPFVQFPEELLSPAVLWSGSREWVRAFRASGLEPGDRIVSALPIGSAFLQLLVAIPHPQVGHFETVVAEPDRPTGGRPFSPPDA